MFLLWLSRLPGQGRPVRQEWLQGIQECVKPKSAFSQILFFLSDIQILPIEVPQEFQEEEEPSQGKVDQGFPQEQRQGARRRPCLRVREEEECSRQVW